MYKRQSQVIFLKQGARRSRYAVRATLVLESCSVIEISSKQEFLNQENKYDKRRTAAIRPGQLAFLPTGEMSPDFLSFSINSLNIIVETTTEIRYNVLNKRTDD